MALGNLHRARLSWSREASPGPLSLPGEDLGPGTAPVGPASSRPLSALCARSRGGRVRSLSLNLPKGLGVGVYFYDKNTIFRDLRRCGGGQLPHSPLSTLRPAGAGAVGAADGGRRWEGPSGRPVLRPPSSGTAALGRPQGWCPGVLLGAPGGSAGAEVPEGGRRQRPAVGQACVGPRSAALGVLGLFRGNPHGAPFCVPGSYAHALDGLYRVAREGEQQACVWQGPGAAPARPQRVPRRQRGWGARSGTRGETRQIRAGAHPAPFLRQRGCGSCSRVRPWRPVEGCWSPWAR